MDAQNAFDTGRLLQGSHHPHFGCPAGQPLPLVVIVRPEAPQPHAPGGAAQTHAAVGSGASKECSRSSKCAIRGGGLYGAHMMHGASSSHSSDRRAGVPQQPAGRAHPGLAKHTSIPCACSAWSKRSAPTTLLLAAAAAVMQPAEATTTSEGEDMTGGHRFVVSAAWRALTECGLPEARMPAGWEEPLRLRIYPLF